MHKNRNILIIALIAIVNALGYGIIIPIIYSYSKQFGLSDFQNGLLFSLYSVCQFISTPILGRMSDKYGRRLPLIISLGGTAVSFFMAAFAPAAIFLFLARALDGLTAGNIPVASAVISDSTEMKDRARGFAIIGAAFGFGFVFGPAISAFTVRFGTRIPFLIAGTISIVSVIVTTLFLPETNKHMGEVKSGRVFDLKKLVEAITYENIGLILFISLIFSLVFGLFIFAFQPFSVERLHMDVTMIAILFTLFGLVGLIVQTFILARVVKWLGDAKTFRYALVVATIGFASLYFATNAWYFMAMCAVIAFGNSFVNPMIQTLLSKETDAQSQGSIQGLNASYISIGMTVGPLLGGLLATKSISLPFLLCGVLGVVCIALSFKVRSSVSHLEHAFSK